MKAQIQSILLHSITTKQKSVEDDLLLQTLEKVTLSIITCYRNGGRVFFCGNGGSAADAQHLAAELSGRFYFDRPPLAAEAMHVNSSYLTAVANDYGYEKVYSRWISAWGQKGDILIGLSTSGNSENVINAMVEAQYKDMITVALTGESGGKMKQFANFLLNAPSSDTPRIQELHITWGHIICQLVEENLFR